MSADEFLERVTAMNENTNAGEVVKLYDEWAETYEDHHFEFEKNFEGEKIFGETVLARGMGVDARIFDAGCGIGMAGVYLKDNFGFKTIDGLDASPVSVEKARGSGAYTNLSSGLMGSGKLRLDWKQYDALICIGCFGFGHIPASAMDEFVCLVKKDGIVMFTIRKQVLDITTEGKSFVDKMNSLEESQTWRLVKKHFYFMHHGVEFGLFIFQVLV